MIVLWVTLLVIHRGYTFIPVTTVQLGEPATLVCVLPKTEFRYRVSWYKQSAGDTLQRIWTLKDSAAREFAPEFTDSVRWKVSYNKNVSNLTILRTNQEDEGIYHCGFTEWLQDTNWTGTYLLVTGNTQRSSNYTVVQEKTDHPGASATLQCSVINNSDNKSCPGGLSVFWIREGAHASHPGIIYTDGNRHHDKKRSETQQRCVYRLSKNVSSSEEGTYYCAVATCGEILFGNGTKLQKQPKGGSEFTALVITTTFMVISMILNIIFICCRTPRAVCEQYKKNSSSQARQNDLRQTVDDSTEGSHDLNYAALHFSGTKAARGKKKKKNELETEESVYSQVRI